MFLEPWMIGVMVLLYGVCHILSFNAGHKTGMSRGAVTGANFGQSLVVLTLVKNKVIDINDEGLVTPIQYENGKIPDDIRTVVNPDFIEAAMKAKAIKRT